jgi:Flp pilus assembly protein TadG
VREESGQSLLELALTLPMLFVMLIGAVEFGRLAYASIEIANAARAGTAYGSLSLINAADITGMQNAATQDGLDVTKWKTTGLTATAQELCACSNSPTTLITCTAAATTCVSPVRTLVFVKVSTTATIDPLFYVPLLPKSYVLSSQAIMRSPQ